MNDSRKMKTIDREELKRKLDRGDEFELVMVLGKWAYQAKHIPGSRHFDTIEDGLKALDKEAEIVVYCSNPACVASRAAYKMLTQHGYTDVRRYAGGLEDWDAAGYALEGEPKTFRPVILAVDDEPRELERVETELRKRYAEDYRVVGEGSAEAASGKLPTTQAPTQVPTQTSERT